MFEKKVLIIKADCDDFEQMYNEKICQFADVLPFSELYDYGERVKKGEKRNIQKRIRELNKIHYFDKYEKIIVFDSFDIVIALVILGRNRRKLYLWLWNLINLNKRKYVELQFIKLFCSVWTFDSSEAQKYGLKLNTQFYFRLEECDEKEKDIDLFFVGLNKGRKRILDKIEETCNRNGISCKIIIVGEKDKSGEVQNALSYYDILQYIRRSKAILEICRDNQKGLTVRAMEALFFERKLITNNKSIYKEQYFNIGNSLIIDEDNILLISDFLKDAFGGYSNMATDYYSISAWLDRFN